MERQIESIIALLLLSPLAFAVEIQANDSLVDKCRLTYPDSKDVDRFLGCIQGDKPAELLIQRLLIMRLVKLKIFVPKPN
jgi:hypothetical protein